MLILEDIKELSDEELEIYTKKRIEELETYYKEKTKSDTIGYDLDYNPSSPDILDYNSSKNSFSDAKSKLKNVCVYEGYVTKGKKIVFCIEQEGRDFTNGGCYYYVDTDDYIYMFLKYIRDKEISSDEDLFIYIGKFIRNYLGIFGDIKREDMLKMIYKNENEYYDRVEEHKFSWFKNKGIGECTEIALMAQNILCFLGYYSAIVMGNMAEKSVKENNVYSDEAHAYNLVAYEDSETGEVVQLLVDFAAATIFYNKEKKLDMAPFIIELEEGIKESVKALLRGYRKQISDYDDYSESDEKLKDKLVFDDYYCSMKKDKLIKIKIPIKREYSIEPFERKKSKKLKKI